LFDGFPAIWTWLLLVGREPCGETAVAVGMSAGKYIRLVE